MEMSSVKWTGFLTDKQFKKFREKNMMKINLKAFTLAVMIFSGFIILVFGIWHSATGFGKEFIKLVESLHPNFARIEFVDSISSIKSIFRNIPAILINVLWALIDGIIIGVSIGLLYNWLLKLDNGKDKQSAGEDGNV